MPGFGMKRYVFSSKYVADPKVYRLEISKPGVKFAVIYMRPVRTQTGIRISRLGYWTETDSVRSRVNA